MWTALSYFLRAFLAIRLVSVTFSPVGPLHGWSFHHECIRSCWRNSHQCSSYQAPWWFELVRWAISSSNWWFVKVLLFCCATVELIVQPAYWTMALPARKELLDVLFLRPRKRKRSIIHLYSLFVCTDRRSAGYCFVDVPDADAILAKLPNIPIPGSNPVSSTTMFFYKCCALLVTDFLFNSHCCVCWVTHSCVRR